MHSWLLSCWGLCLAVLVGCDGVLADHSGTLCNADGSCIADYHCVRETWRCNFGSVDESVCAITTCANADGCCPQGCHANNDTDCPAVCGNLQREPEEECDDGNGTHEDDCPNTCKPNVCGDGAVDRQEPHVEDCDDGNTVTEQECAYGTRTCTLCDSTCTASLSLTGRSCGDGFQNGPSEQCDDGNTSNQDNCLGTCTLATCGDGFLNTVSGEVCDDGNTVNETSCPYGPPICTTCNSTCNGTLNLTGRYCGDGAVSDGEACDDGDTETESKCDYGTPSCTLCNADCSATLPRTGFYCGDKRVDGPEACDDGNATACGTCSSTCEQNQLVKATGSITTIQGMYLKDEETFSISDGIHTAVILEFDKNGSPNSSQTIPVSITDASSGADVATAIVNAINDAVAPLEIVATTSSSSSPHVVNLIHTREGGSGNQGITETVSKSAFKVSGMSGGGGLDCPEGTPCMSNKDCESEVCLAGTCSSP
jgi:cysteine-rich repeat protein